MSEYESTLRWYAKNDPYDYAGIMRLVSEQKSLDNAPDDLGGDGDLSGKKVFLVVGHEPGGGAEGEREWNIEVAQRLESKLRGRGAFVITYEHKVRAYGQRCDEMRDACLTQMPDADCVILMHYNAYSDTSAHGHEFHYGGYKEFAESIRDAWQEAFPNSRPRQDNGILHNTDGNGSLMIRSAPAACCLLEPFFATNLNEREQFIEAHQDVAEVYAKGISSWLKNE